MFFGSPRQDSLGSPSWSTVACDVEWRLTTTHISSSATTASRSIQPPIWKGVAVALTSNLSEYGILDHEPQDTSSACNPIFHRIHSRAAPRSATSHNVQGTSYRRKRTPKESKFTRPNPILTQIPQNAASTHHHQRSKRQKPLPNHDIPKSQPHPAETPQRTSGRDEVHLQTKA